MLPRRDDPSVQPPRVGGHNPEQVEVGDQHMLSWRSYVLTSTSVWLEHRVQCGEYCKERFTGRPSMKGLIVHGKAFSL